MRLGLPLLAGAILLAVAPAHAADREDRAAAEMSRLLEGRVAGKPVDCINLRDIRSTRIISRTAIVYETIGGKLYVNRPDSGRNFLDKWDVLVTDTHSDRLCSIDIVRLYDNGARMPSGSVGLGEFVPYTKKPKRQS